MQVLCVPRIMSFGDHPDLSAHEVGRIKRQKLLVEGKATDGIDEIYSHENENAGEKQEDNRYIQALATDYLDPITECLCDALDVQVRSRLDTDTCKENRFKVLKPPNVFNSEASYFQMALNEVALGGLDISYEATNIFAEIDGTRDETLEPEVSCSHLIRVCGALRAEEIIEYLMQRKCSFGTCSEMKDLYFCLACFHWFCGTKKGGHKYEHYERKGDSVFFCVEKEKIWCQACNKCLENDNSLLGKWFEGFHRAKNAESVWFQSKCEQRSAYFGGGTHDDACAKSQMPRSATDTMLTTSLKNHENKMAEKCAHLKSVKTSFNKVPASLKIMCQYTQCPFQSDLSICLCCYKIFCGDHGDQHMGLHMLKNEGHAICMYFKDLSFWCYRCSRFIDAPSSKLLTKIRNRFVALAFGASCTGALEVNFADASSSAAHDILAATYSDSSVETNGL